ncbi:/ ackA / Acetate kinase /:397400 Reverse [Candidatus Hepatoplasma crinochetorum]|uniref:Acetate kinase n=1 Tax=Candidatus Hepatoplasma crinochetorum TaxID=295596 RepID=A0A0G7ZMV8_9MOLU|nr:/ ackA / Acetate kinase /:397400 Reverse [Candidatus Hepatoplasma crinochetorum]
MKKILILNVGSSSCKFQLFTSDLELLGKGLIDRIGIENTSFEYQDSKGKKISKKDFFLHKDLGIKLQEFIEDNKICDFNDLYLMVHRIVMGAELFPQNIIVKDFKIIEKIESLTPLAPLHQPYNVIALKKFFKTHQEIKHVAVFDTTFHSTIPEKNFIFPIPHQFYKEYKIRRYGAHGTSHQYITEQVKKILQKEEVTFINFHLGNGASACLIKDSKSYDTSMGLTPLGGLMMGTRSGDLDPSIAFYLINQKKLSAIEVENIFIKKSGLLGVYGKSPDMRDVILGEKKGDKRAILAREIFTKRINDYLAIYLNEVKKIDAICFTGGIGENDHDLIRKVFKNFNLRKINLIDEFNRNLEIALISKKDSEIPIYIIKTNEELQMAKIAQHLLAKDK